MTGCTTKPTRSAQQRDEQRLGEGLMRCIDFGAFGGSTVEFPPRHIRHICRGLNPSADYMDGSCVQAAARRTHRQLRRPRTGPHRFHRHRQLDGLCLPCRPWAAPQAGPAAADSKVPRRLHRPAKQSKAKLSKAKAKQKQSKAKQSKAKQSKAKQSKAKQARMRRHR